MYILILQYVANLFHNTQIWLDIDFGFVLANSPGSNLGLESSPTKEFAEVGFI